MVLITGGTALGWLYTVEWVDDNIRHTVRLSAAFAFWFYLAAVTARPLHQLARRPWTAKLLRFRRLLGVAFVGVMTAHLMLIVMRFTATPGLDYPLARLAAGGLVYGLIYLLFVTSFDGPTKALGAKAWKRLHRIGIVAIGIVFALPRSSDEMTDPAKLKFTIPLLVVILLRFIAWQRSKPRDS